MNKILTLIIPTYNMEKYIEKCINSILVPQKNILELLDILVINDGSKDNSLHIAHKFEVDYPGVIRVIDKENGNYGSCINRGLIEAKGKYVKILDADDTFDKENISNFIRILKDSQEDCIITDFIEKNEVGKYLRVVNYKGLPHLKTLNLEQVSDVLLEKLSMHAVTYKTSIFRNNYYHQTEGISFTDIEWIFMPISYSKTFKYIPINIYQYLIGRPGQTVDPHRSTILLKDTLKGIEVQTELIEKATNLNKEQRSYLIRKLTKRLLRNFIIIINTNNNHNNIEALKDLYLRYKDCWQNMGVSLKILTKIPVLNISYISEWEKNDFNSNIPYRIIFKLYNRIYNICCYHIPFIKYKYLTIKV